MLPSHLISAAPRSAAFRLAAAWSARTALLLLPLGIALAAGAPAAEARQGFFLGAGLAQQSGSGDLDGTHAVTDSTGTVALVDGKLSSGGGLSFDIGYGFNRFVGVEFMVAGTLNTASAPGLPDTRAAVSSALLGLRLTVPVGSSFDLFARVGVSGHAVTYPDHVLQGTSSGGVFTSSGAGKDNATFSGGGTGAGLGAEIFMGHVGLGLGVTQFTASFDQATKGGPSEKLPRILNETFTVGDLTVAYHF